MLTLVLNLFILSIACILNLALQIARSCMGSCEMWGAVPREVQLVRLSEMGHDAPAAGGERTHPQGSTFSW